MLDALEQSLHDRGSLVGGGLVHPSDRGSQYVLIKYTERLAEAGLEPSVGPACDSFDNAQAAMTKEFYNTEVIWRKGPWRSLNVVEYATLEWVNWLNNRRLVEPICNVPPAETEAAHFASQGGNSYIAA